MTDFTNKNTNRRLLSIVQHPVDSVLPEHFYDSYPNLSVFLKKYYEYLDNNNTPETIIHSLFNNSDLNSISDQFLEFLEQQFLLGRNNFSGYDEKRSAIRQSSYMYRSKGSKFSLEQFFRLFYGIDADVVYTKENVFIVAESEIGPESLRYIIDNKLYQTFALLIKTSLPFSDYQELYKLFVHPAGMYVGSQVQIVTEATVIVPDDGSQPDVIPAEDPGLQIVTSATVVAPDQQYTGITGLVPLSQDSDYRIGFNNTVAVFDTITVDQTDAQYDDIAQAMIATSPRFDEDSAPGDPGTIGMSNTIETMDQDLFLIYDSA